MFSYLLNLSQICRNNEIMVRTSSPLEMQKDETETSSQQKPVRSPNIRHTRERMLEQCWVGISVISIKSRLLTSHSHSLTHSSHHSSSLRKLRLFQCPVPVSKRNITARVFISLLKSQQSGDVSTHEVRTIPPADIAY